MAPHGQCGIAPVAAVLLALAACAVALPSHYHSCTFNFTGGQRLPYKFCDPKAPLDDRIADLLSRMTFEEKCFALDASGTLPPLPRLGLAPMNGGESTHGVASGCGAPAPGTDSTGCPTSFPSGPGLGASYDRDLWAAVGGVIGTEARGLNNQGDPGVAVNMGHAARGVPGLPKSGVSGLYFLDPNINLCRDARWGRCQEVPGEDPTLTAEYAVHLINGTQRGPDPRFLLAASTAKHFSMYDIEGYIPRTDLQPSPASGTCDTPGGCERWNFDMRPPLGDFHDYYLAPFKAAVQRANVRSIMCSYNAAFGKPTCADPDVNNGLVRGNWSWDGFYVSDCTALELMQDAKWDNCKHPWPSEGGTCVPDPFPGGHNYTHSVDETVSTALVTGGIDYNCGSLYKTNLYSSLQRGAVTEADVDRAAGRVYKTQFLLGMLDPMDDQPYVRLGSEVVDSNASRAVALRAARESLVLLKNDGGLLPLPKSVASVAFIGPHANSTQSLLSNYHGKNSLVESNSPLMAAARRGINVTHAYGCRICDFPYGKNPGFPNMPCPLLRRNERAGIADAAAAAKAADAAVLFLGLDQTCEAENFDRDSIALPANQEALVRAVLAVQPCTVVVLVHGGAIASDALKNDVPAVLDAFYPGELGGPAVVDALFGDYVPSGKLPVTVYHANFTKRDIRVTDLRADGGITHLWFTGPVQWPFGHGLSYTSFEYAWAAGQALPDVVTGVAALLYSVVVRNTGSLEADCVVLAFVSSTPLTHPDVPRRRLVGFERVRGLAAGEAATVRFELGVDDAVGFADRGGVARPASAAGPIRVDIGDVANPVSHAFVVR